MAEPIESKMNRIFRRLFLQAFEDGSPDERRGMISRTRFDRACSLELKCKNVRRNTDGYWGTAQSMGLISFPPVDTMRDQLQTYSRAIVREDIWAADGFIFNLQEQLQQQMSLKVEKVKKRSKDAISLEELI